MTSLQLHQMPHSKHPEQRCPYLQAIARGNHDFVKTGKGHPTDSDSYFPNLERQEEKENRNFEGYWASHS